MTLSDSSVDFCLVFKLHLLDCSDFSSVTDAQIFQMLSSHLCMFRRQLPFSSESHTGCVEWRVSAIAIVHIKWRRNDQLHLLKLWVVGHKLKFLCLDFFSQLLWCVSGWQLNFGKSVNFIYFTERALNVLQKLKYKNCRIITNVLILVLKFITQ